MTERYIKIETPKINKKDREAALLYAMQHLKDIQNELEKSQNPVYLPWSKIKYKDQLPADLTPVKFWTIVKMLRMGGNITPVVDIGGTPFRWNKPRHYDRLLHELDLNTGGRLLGLETVSEEEKGQYITRGLIEEAIASSQLEGAHTTRDAAKKMIREGMAPRDRGQKMILNNYEVMRKIQTDYKNEPLSISLILDMHGALTRDTLDNPDQAGRFRKDEEKIVVGSNNSDKISYVAPPMAFVKEQIPRFIDYANDSLAEDVHFTHPVIKAAILHFWTGFLHPFADGNGRLARAIFYWYLLRKGYWAFSYLPLSTRIKQSPAQYANAYIYSEQDDNDLTYFIDYKLRKIQLSIRDFVQYARGKASESVALDKMEARFPDLNHRQLSLMKYFSCKTDERTNITAMQKIYNVSTATAINDLRYLVRQGWLRKQQRGRHTFYYPTEKLFVKTGRIS